MRTVDLLSQLRSRGVKVWAEGDRLRYSAPKGALSADQLAQLAARKAEILNFLQKAATARPTAPPIQPRAHQAELPLSFAQQRLWFLDQMSPGLASYNIPSAIRLSGELDTAALQQSLNVIISRHEALRTTFTAVDGEPIQVIHPSQPLVLHEVDLRALPVAEREAAAARAALAEAQQPFDLEHGPLVRAVLIRIADTECLVVFTLHHIIADAWSIGVLIRELAALYKAQISGQLAALPELPVQYADFALWQRQWLAPGAPGDALEQLAYWRRQLEGHPPTLDLPIARARPREQTFEGTIRSFKLSPQLSAWIAALSQREDVTLFMTLLAGFEVLLYRYTRQTDLLVGSPIANRTRAEIEPLIGFFVNTLVLRVDLAGNPSVRELLQRVRDVTLAAYAHQDLPFERLVEELRPERDPSRTPLFQVMFVLQNAAMDLLELPGLTLQASELGAETAKFDLLLAFVETPHGLLGELEYNTDLFDHTSIERMIGHLQTLLEQMVAYPDRRIDQLALLTVAEREQILHLWNDTRAPAPDCCVHELFEQQAARTPSALAVELPLAAAAGLGRTEATQLTYGQLNQRANQLAYRLRALGVGPDARVAICMERSPELMLSVLAVLKAGGAYVPLDPSYPVDRLHIMLADSGAAVLLTIGQAGAAVAALRARFAGHVIDLAADWPSIADESTKNPASVVLPANLAYVIYTSGSTGRPKGIAMTHSTLANLLAWQLRSFTIPHPARTVQFSSPSFDVSFQELFSTWCSGGTLVLITEELRRDPLALVRFLNDNAIERLFLPVVMLQQIAEVVAAHGLMPAHLREMMVAGEQLRITPLIVNWLSSRPDCVVHNHYGPSESHAVTALTLYGPPEEWPALPPVGQPIANMRVYVLDVALEPVPVGVPGELCIGGSNLARGYLDRPNLTAEKFIPDLFAAADDAPQASSLTGDRWANRLYRTGDLVRFRPDGVIEFLGRVDHQIKLRGYRIELGEVASVLEQHPGVHEAIVLVREDVPGDPRLVAYVIEEPRAEHQALEGAQQRGHTDQAAGADGAQLSAPGSAGELRAFMQDRLPDYMVPTLFVPLDAWPLTPSGKVDRRALPAPQSIGFERLRSYVAPRDTLELELVRIWESLLGGQTVGVHDNFFELGGHSLLVVRLMSQVQKQFGQTLPLSTLFQRATVEHLARMLRHQVGPLPYSPVVGIQPAGRKRPLFCVHPGAGNVLCYMHLAHRLGSEQPFYGLQSSGLEADQLLRTQVEEMASVYVEALRSVQTEGPYRLAGWSFGGLVAFEMARQLDAQGQAVDLLALIDSYAPTPDPQPALDESALLAWFAYDLGRQIGKVPPISDDDLRRISPDQRLRFVLEQARAADILPEDIDEQQIRRALDVFATNIQAIQRYRPPVYAGRVVLFRASELPTEAHPDPALGWGDLAAGGVEVHSVPGDHYTIVSPPHVEVLAERLSACIAAL